MVIHMHMHMMYRSIAMFLPHVFVQEHVHVHAYIRVHTAVTAMIDLTSTFASNLQLQLQTAVGRIFFITSHPIAN